MQCHEMTNVSKIKIADDCNHHSLCVILFLYKKNYQWNMINDKIFKKTVNIH